MATSYDSSYDEISYDEPSYFYRMTCIFVSYDASYEMLYDTLYDKNALSYDKFRTMPSYCIVRQLVAISSYFYVNFTIVR